MIDTLSFSSDRSSFGSRRRHLVRMDAAESMTAGDELAGYSPYNTMGLASPTGHSGSSAGFNYEQDSFQRFSMRRKSMALAYAVNMDLINREQSMHWNHLLPFSQCTLISTL